VRSPLFCRAPDWLQCTHLPKPTRQSRPTTTSHHHPNPSLTHTRFYTHKLLKPPNNPNNPPLKRTTPPSLFHTHTLKPPAPLPQTPNNTPPPKKKNKTQADLALADVNQNTALHLALMERNLDVAQALIRAGSPLDVPNRSNKARICVCLCGGRCGGGVGVGCG
jgi:ankyrin repeat protein